MKREFKFRAWDGSFMVGSEYGDWISFDGIPYTEYDKKHNTPNIEIQKANKYIVMQYTGLKDKNGVEIYEGDIITCQTKNYQYPHKGEVIFLEHIAGFGITTEPIINESSGEEEPAFTYFHYNESIEVIGNIHQNPELLKP